MTFSLGNCNFLEEISSLSHSNLFLYFFALITEEGFLISPCYLELSLKWVYVSFSPLSFASLLFTAVCKASSDNHFAFLHFFFLWLVLNTASCTMSRTSIHSSSDTLCARSNPLNLFVTSTVLLEGIWFRSCPKWYSGFPFFLQFKSEFSNKEFMIWAIVSSQYCFC